MLRDSSALPKEVYPRDCRPPFEKVAVSGAALRMEPSSSRHFLVLWY
jgi:hypothetical protein